MARLLIRVVINAVALYVAAAVLGENMSVPTDALGLAIVALVFGLVNAFIKPIVTLLTCPLTIVTLGLFTIVVNALMLMLTGWLTGGQVAISGFGWALVGGIIVGIVSTLLSMFLANDDR